MQYLFVFGASVTLTAVKLFLFRIVASLPAWPKIHYHLTRSSVFESLKVGRGRRVARFAESEGGQSGSGISWPRPGVNATLS